MKHYDVLIVGGGASGLACAITLKRNEKKLSVGIVEKKEMVGKKLSVTGNGKCNLTNMDCPKVGEIINFFSSVGVPVRTDEDGRVYPYSEDAAQVVTALRDEALKLGVEINTGISVMKIKPNTGGLFEVMPGFTANKVVISTGGKSYASYGTTGDGYIFAKDLGHIVTPLIPGLTGIEVSENIQTLKGIRAKGTVGLYENGELVLVEKGEVQFREDSISGICVMNISNHIRRGKDYKILINFVPDFPKATIDDMYNAKALLKPELMKYIKERNLDPRKVIFTPSGLKGWNEAQITCGGVSLDDVDMATMESRVVKNLYFTGEVLDIQEQCGGYNLNNAWTTGITCGLAIAEEYF